MSEVRVGENESLDNALRRFRRQCSRAGVLSELRKREHYESPSVKRKKNQKQQERENINIINKGSACHDPKRANIQRYGRSYEKQR